MKELLCLVLLVVSCLMVVFQPNKTKKDEEVSSMTEYKNNMKYYGSITTILRSVTAISRLHCKILRHYYDNIMKYYCSVTTIFGSITAVSRGITAVSR